MNQDFDFFKTSMPNTRKADYYLGCLGGSVFIDFDRSSDDQISLVRISFDGYGCCNIGGAKLLNHADSRKFIEEFKKEKLSQEIISKLVREIIKINKEYIWEDAIEEYGFIEK